MPQPPPSRTLLVGFDVLVFFFMNYIVLVGFAALVVFFNSIVVNSIVVNSIVVNSLPVFFINSIVVSPQIPTNVFQGLDRRHPTKRMPCDNLVTCANMATGE